MPEWVCISKEGEFGVVALGKLVWQGVGLAHPHWEHIGDEEPLPLLIFPHSPTKFAARLTRNSIHKSTCVKAAISASGRKWIFHASRQAYFIHIFPLGLLSASKPKPTARAARLIGCLLCSVSE
jgi:hypothetical protein